MSRKKILLIIMPLLLTVTLSTSYVYKDDISYLYGYSKAAISYWGSRGQEVRNIQTKLQNWGYYNGNVDGIYGPKTYNAVRDFQAKNGLKIDGVAGSQTLAALGLPTGDTQASAGWAASSKDENLLAHIIHGEARGEPYTGQVAVGAVVLNRTRDSRFPSTIAGVIYQPGAFDAVADGQMNLQPDETAYKAARDALNGWDPSYGCLYYYNPVTATSKWVWDNLRIVVKIGKHNFASPR